MAAVAARGAELPEFVDILDKCESLWRAERYQELYDNIGNLEYEARDYVPTRLSLAWRYAYYGEQFELQRTELQWIANETSRVVCEVNPDFPFDLKGMISGVEVSLEVCEKLGQSTEYRRMAYDPRLRKRTRITRWGGSNSEFPFLVPDIFLAGSPHTNHQTCALQLAGRKPPLKAKEMEHRIYASKEGLSCRQKKDLLDDYVVGFVSRGGIGGLIENFKDRFVQLDGYTVLAILRERPQEVKPLLKEYVEREVPPGGWGEGKRLALWALLQFAHDDPEIAEYLRKLPESKLGGAACFKVKGYLRKAVKHLNEGCTRTFSPSSSK